MFMSTKTNVGDDGLIPKKSISLTRIFLASIFSSLFITFLYWGINALLLNKRNVYMLEVFFGSLLVLLLVYYVDEVMELTKNKNLAG